MADYGLLGGLAEGFKQGLIAYKGERSRLEEIEKEKANREYQKERDKQDFDLRKQQVDATDKARQSQESIEALKSGLIKNVDNNSYQYDTSSPAYKAQQTKQKGEELGLLKTQAEIGKLKAETGAKKLPDNETAFKMLPKDKQITIEKSSNKKADIDSIRDQMNNVVTQLKDPNINDRQKLQIANESAKLINSTLGADAVGAEEVKRLLNYLEYTPQPFGPKGYKVGPDIKSFTTALENNAKRIGDTSDQIQARIDAAYGRQPKKGLLQETSQQKPKAQTIKQNGITYTLNPQTGEYE